MTVLVVDDMDDMRALARVNLEVDPRFEVIGEAADGREAIEAARQLRPVVVLLDLEMPWMSGPEAIPFIKSEVPDAHIVIWTVTPEGPRARSALDLGAVAVIDKGSTPLPRLANALGDVLEDLAQRRR